MDFIIDDLSLLAPSSFSSSNNGSNVVSSNGVSNGSNSHTNGSNDATTREGAKSAELWSVPHPKPQALRPQTLYLHPHGGAERQSLAHRNTFLNPEPGNIFLNLRPKPLPGEHGRYRLLKPDPDLGFLVRLLKSFGGVPSSRKTHLDTRQRLEPSLTCGHLEDGSSHFMVEQSAEPPQPHTVEQRALKHSNLLNNGPCTRCWGSRVRVVGFRGFRVRVVGLNTTPPCNPHFTALTLNPLTRERLELLRFMVTPNPQP